MKITNYSQPKVLTFERKTITSAPLPDADYELKPIASVIIVNYNNGEELIRCIDSVFANSPLDIEVILVDNDSRDESDIRAAALFPQIQLVHNIKNNGFGAGNNLGACGARGKYLVFLNPDTIVAGGWLRALIKAMEANPKVGLATSKVLLLKNPHQINTCGNNVHMSGLTMCRGMGSPADDYNQQEYVDAISGAAFAIRRDLYETLGGFDPMFFLYLEDTDLSWRTHLAGYRCLFVPESVVYHDYTLTFGPRKTFYLERNRYLMLLKSLSWTTLLVLLPVLLLAEVITWGFELTRDRRNWTNKLQAYAWVISNWKAIMQQRHQIQKMRQVSDATILHATKHRLIYEQTGQGFAVRAAHWLFDPIFREYQNFIRWMFQLEKLSKEDDNLGEDSPSLLSHEVSS